MRNRNKKSDNLRDVVLSKKNPSQADVGELFQDRSLSGQLRFKKGINDFLTLLSEAQIQALIDAIPVPESPTTTVVNISSPQIRNIGATPVELLPAPVGNKYYTGTIRLEYDYIFPAYDFGSPGKFLAVVQGTNYLSLISSFTLANLVSDGYLEIDFNSLRGTDLNSYATIHSFHGIVNDPVTLVSVDGNFQPYNPTLGNGTMRAIITYTEHTFGA